MESTQEITARYEASVEKVKETDFVAWLNSQQEISEAHSDDTISRTAARRVVKIVSGMGVECHLIDVAQMSWVGARELLCKAQESWKETTVMALKRDYQAALTRITGRRHRNKVMLDWLEGR